MRLGPEGQKQSAGNLKSKQNDYNNPYNREADDAGVYHYIYGL